MDTGADAVSNDNPNIFIDPNHETRGDDMKIAVLFGIILLALIALESTESIPFSETITIKGDEDPYTLDLAVLIYVKRGATYEVEDRIIRIVVDPRERALIAKFHFLKVLVSIDITDSTGKTTADFQSYLNGNLKDCDVTTPEGQLFWDHAGEKRADKAGEPFTEDAPLTVKDAHCNVKMRLINSLYSQYLANVFPGERDTDLECLLPLRGLTVGIDIDYSPEQAIIVDLFEKASEHVQTGDDFFQAGDMDQAFIAYEKAKAVYNQLGDAVKSNRISEQIKTATLLKASEHAALGDQFFEAGEYEKAAAEYEKAKTQHDAVYDQEMSTTMQKMIVTCTSYATAVKIFNNGVETFKEAESTPYSWKAVEKYKEAKSNFETAKAEFDKVGDQKKSDECVTWINQCNTKIASAAPKEVEPVTPTIRYSLEIVIGAGVVLWWLWL